MRFLFEFAVILGLVLVGWRQPYRQHLVYLFPDRFAPAPVSAAATPEPATPSPGAAPRVQSPTPDLKPRSESWLWEPKAMDKPYNNNGTRRVPDR